MNPLLRFPLPFLLGAILALLPGCPGSRSTGAGTVTDFALMDVNPNSATFQLSVSPRDHLGHVTAWYFGSAT